MKKIRLSELSGMRVPTGDEIRSVSAHMEAYYASGMRITRIAGVIMTALAVLMFAGLTAQAETGGRAVCIVLAAGSAFGAFAALRHCGQIRREERYFEEGRFLVADGKVSGIKANLEQPGVSNVEFTSLNRETAAGLFEVRKEDLEVGTPLLLVYADGRDFPGGKAFSWAFTPFMLTEEGVKKHRL